MAASMEERPVSDPHLRPAGLRGIAADLSSDQRAFKNVSWGKAMMWIFILSDIFIFGCFLLAYMAARMSATLSVPDAVPSGQVATFSASMATNCASSASLALSSTRSR